MLKQILFMTLVDYPPPKFIIVDVDSMNQSDLCSATVNWIKNYYKNPDEVLKSKIENKKIRFSGMRSSYLEFNFLGKVSYLDVFYTIEVEFKDGKYKFQPIYLEYQYDINKTSINLEDGSLYYNNKNQLRKTFAGTPSGIQKLFNDINESIFKYFETEYLNPQEDW